MSNGGITGDLLTAVGKHSVEYYECVDILIGEGYYITNAPRDVIVGSQTYTALGQLLDFGDVQVNITFEISNLEIRVSGLPAYDDSDQIWTTRVLGETYQNREVKISRAYFTFENNSHTRIGSFEIYKGFIDTVGIRHEPTGESAVSIDTTSHWVDFYKTIGHFTNENGQKSMIDINLGLTLFTDDEGYSFASRAQKDIEWK